jgi:hypothetical protein
MAVTEHAESLLSPGDGERGLLSRGHEPAWSPTRPTWATTRTSGRRSPSRPPTPGTATFTGLRGFEWTSDRLGHINVLFSENFNQAYAGTDNVDMTEFWSWFTRSPALGGGSDGLGVFNHPGAKDVSTADPQRNWNDFAYVPAADRRMVGIEVFNRGSEFGSQGGNGGYLAHALDRGWHLGAVGAEDSHDTGWGDADRPKTGRPRARPLPGRHPRGPAGPAVLRDLARATGGCRSPSTGLRWAPGCAARRATRSRSRPG